MSATPFLQLYVGDYLSDTLDLTTEQHGAYLLLLMTMWRHGAKLQNDPAKLARIARVSARRWHLVWAGIEHFFYVDGEFIHNNRLEREHKKALSISEKRSASGAKGGRSKSMKTKEPCEANASDLPKHSQKSKPEEANASSAPVPADEKLAHAERLTKLRRKVVAAYHPDLPPDTGHCAVWIGQGYDPDICAGVVEAAVERGKKPRTLRYFDSAIQEAHERKAPRLAPAKPVTPPNLSKLPQSRWKRLLDDWFRDPKSWPDLYGPQPGTPGCMCPQDIIDLENERRGKVAA